MSVLQDTFQAIEDRLTADMIFKNYFRQLETFSLTEVIDEPYFLLGAPGLEVEPHTISLGEVATFRIPIQFVIKNDDSQKTTYEYLKAIEIFLNAYYGSDCTFDGKINKTLFSFADPQEQENNSIVGSGEIEIQLNIFSQGGL